MELQQDDRYWARVRSQAAAGNIEVAVDLLKDALRDLEDTEDQALAEEISRALKALNTAAGHLAEADKKAAAAQ